jgi:hypothetical protein
MSNKIAAACMCVLVAAVGSQCLDAQSAATDEQQVLTAIQELIRSYSARDGVAAGRIYHANLSYGHTNGQIDTKEFAVKDVESGMWRLAKLLDAKVQLTGAVAVVRTTMNYAADCAEPKGTCGVRVLWVLVKENGSWQVLARQAGWSFNNPTVLCCAQAAAVSAKQQNK